MAMNLMEAFVYELAPEGTIGVCGGIAMCIVSMLCCPDHANSEMQDDEERCLVKFLIKIIHVWMSNSYYPEMDEP
jgi:hypothetical protein